MGAIKGYSILLVCDFSNGLLSRVVDVYRFFEKPPSILLARRGGTFGGNPGLSLESQTIPIPLKGWEGGRLELGLLFSTAAYFLYAILIRLRVRVRQTISLVHAHYIFPQGLFGLLLATLLGVPLVVTATGQDVNLMMRKSILLRGMCRWVLKCADVTLAVSKPLQRRLSNCGIKDAVYLPNSVDTESIPKVEGSANKERILFVGNLTENKRPLVLIKAFEDVIKLVPGATLIMCGDGPLRTMVQEEVEKSGLSGKVRTLLNVRPEVLNTLRSRTGIFVLPSIAEGLSMALLESMAAGQAVIASRNESHLSILEHGKNCLLFDPDDSDQLAAEIVLVMSDDRLRLEIGQAAKQLCEAQFSNRVVAQELENIYLRTISR